jgi:tetratricopeptide (TPR) repeat protein
MERINHQVYLALYLAMAVVLGREARGVSGVVTSQPNIRLIRWGGAGVVLVLIAGVVYATAALRQERFVRLAREAFVEEDWRSTVYYTQRAATPLKTLDPFATPVSYLEGMGHLMLADLPSALACMERARKEMPSRAYIVNSLGLVHQMMGNYEASIACFAEVLRRSPTYWTALHGIAINHLRAGRPFEATEAIDKVPAEARTKEMSVTRERASKQALDDLLDTLSGI